MTLLYIVPNTHLRRWRRKAAEAGDTFLPLTIASLVSQILRDGLVSYQEDEILEEIALWQAVQLQQKQLEFFAPIANYPGFMQELKWLIGQIDSKEDIWKDVPPAGTEELRLLHQTYHDQLEEHGLLDRRGQLKAAMQLAKKQKLLPHISAIELRGLSELSPLEVAFLQAFARDRPLRKVSAQASERQLKVVQAQNPYEEVEMIGLAIRDQLEQGAPFSSIAVAFPNPTQYLPILLPVFRDLGLAWQSPATSLSNTPFGKAILTLIAGELAGWQRHHLQLLTAPGWGFPFKLTPEEQRKLRLAPYLKGLPAWRNYLGEHEGWEKVFVLIAGVQNQLYSRPLSEYGAWLEGLLVELQPEQWILPEEDSETWATLVKAWDGLALIAEKLGRCTSFCDPNQFLQLFRALLENYLIRARREFQERLQVLSIKQLGAAVYDTLYVGGLVEGEFPGFQHAHWLTKTKSEYDVEESYERILNSAANVILSFPETDREGKLNLPSIMLPEVELQEGREISAQSHRPSLYFGDGFLSDEDLLVQIKERILRDGLTVSQLNSYARCPYQFYCDYVLELEVQEEESLELDARDRGIILHKVLYRFWEQYLDAHVPDLAQAQLELEGLTRNEYSLRGEEPPPRLIRSLRWFARQDLARIESGFRPKFLERGFRNLVIDTKSGPVQIRGQIDRIDQRDDGAYVLYDYKSGSAPGIQDILRGRDVQIAVYLLAAQKLLPEASNMGVAYYLFQTAKPVGIFRLDVHKQLLIHRNRGCLAGEEFNALIGQFAEQIREYLEAILAGEFPIEPSNTSHCRFCAFQAICRKEVPLQ